MNIFGHTAEQWSKSVPLHVTKSSPGDSAAVIKSLPKVNEKCSCQTCFKCKGSNGPMYVFQTDIKGECDCCNRAVDKGEIVTGHRECNWWLCSTKCCPLAVPSLFTSAKPGPSAAVPLANMNATMAGYQGDCVKCAVCKGINYEFATLSHGKCDGCGRNVAKGEIVTGHAKPCDQWLCSNCCVKEPPIESDCVNCPKCNTPMENKQMTGLSTDAGAAGAFCDKCKRPVLNGDDVTSHSCGVLFCSNCCGDAVKKTSSGVDCEICPKCNLQMSTFEPKQNGHCDGCGTAVPTGETVTGHYNKKCDYWLCYRCCPQDDDSFDVDALSMPVAPPSLSVKEISGTFTLQSPASCTLHAASRVWARYIKIQSPESFPPDFSERMSELYDMRNADQARAFFTEKVIRVWIASADASTFAHEVLSFALYNYLYISAENIHGNIGAWTIDVIDSLWQMLANTRPNDKNELKTMLGYNDISRKLDRFAPNISIEGKNAFKVALSACIDRLYVILTRMPGILASDPPVYMAFNGNEGMGQYKHNKPGYNDFYKKNVDNNIAVYWNDELFDFVSRKGYYSGRAFDWPKEWKWIGGHATTMHYNPVDKTYYVKDTLSHLTNPHGVPFKVLEPTTLADEKANPTISLYLVFPTSANAEFLESKKPAKKPTKKKGGNVTRRVKRNARKTTRRRK
jgi:hypothetical protein